MEDSSLMYSTMLHTSHPETREPCTDVNYGSKNEQVESGPLYQVPSYTVYYVDVDVFA